LVGVLPSDRDIFPSADALGVPLIKAEGFEPSYLVPHRQKVRTDRPVEGGAVHFFLDDERFEPVWKTPEKGLSYVGRLGSALTPDFSLYPEMPLALQLYNVYRNRWCGAFWRSRGVRVIPTVGWSDESSYPFCFLGIEEGSTVAVSTVGLGDPRGTRGATEEGRALFRAGFAEMLERISPRLVLLYGEAMEGLLPEEAGRVRIRSYPSRWSGIREERRRITGEAARARSRS
jgi:hypothetical protein